jgi:hypothetical protein
MDNPRGDSDRERRHTDGTLTSRQRRDLQGLIQRELGSAWDSTISRGTNVEALRETITSLVNYFAKTKDVQNGGNDAADREVIRKHR